MRSLFYILFISLMVTSCQNLSKHTDLRRSISSEDYQAQIKSDKKRQAELDLPFRGFGVDKNIQIIAFGPAATDYWETIEKNKPELMILTTAPIKKLSKTPEYRSVREKIPFMCAPNSDKTEFIKDWPYVKNIIPENQDGAYHSKTFGIKKNKIQVIMVDELNSEKKWSWLENELKKPTALKILSSPIGEREKIFVLIKKSKTKNLILLPQDSAITNFEKTEIKNTGAIYEAQTQSRNISSENQPLNFGLIKINWSARAAQLEIRTTNDQKVQKVDLNF